MHWSASVLTSVSSDTEPTIIITFDKAKYIFNAGENTIRSFLQSKNSWKRAEGLFFTQVGTQRAGGLPGLLMSFADATITKLDVVGPPGLLHYMASMRMYTFRDRMPVYATEASSTPDLSSTPNHVFKDQQITVYAIPVSQTLHDPPAIPASQPFDAPDVSVPALDEESRLKRKREPSPETSSKRSTAATGEPSESTAHASASHLSTFQSVIKDPDFSPVGLEGEFAQNWRRKIIQTMFPATGKPAPDKALKAQRKYEQRKLQKELNKELRKASESSSATSAASEPTVNSEEVIAELKKQLRKAQEAASDSAVNSEDGNVDRHSRERLPQGFHDQLPTLTPPTPVPGSDPSSRPTLAYVIVGPHVRGVFDQAKAKELRIPWGPVRSQLSKGETITYKVKEGGIEVERTVRPEEVVGVSEAPSVVLIFDVPTPSHIPSLISSFADSPFYAKFLNGDSEEYLVRSAFHICGDGVLEDERYIGFMNSFGLKIHHIVSSRKHCPDPVTFTSAAFNLLRLNQLDPEIFSVPKFSLTPQKDISTIPNLPGNTSLMLSNTLVGIRPPAPPTHQTPEELHDRFHMSVASAKPLSLPAVTADCFSEAQRQVQELEKTRGLQVSKAEDVVVIPLGTGSALPTKYRNVSSTLIQIPKSGNILLDAGEGTWGQLSRQFGLDESSPTNVWQVLRDLKCIYVSHVHGDHHMGVATILAKRRQLDPPPTEPLYLVTIRPVQLYLRELSNIQDLGIDDPSGNGVIPIMTEAVHWKQVGSYMSSGTWRVAGNEPWTDMEKSRDLEREMCAAIGLKSFRTVDVWHRTRCYGAVIKHNDDWSIVFSGDTQPCDNLVYAGRGATLLIHEATMADDQVAMAAAKAHSTFGQACHIGKRMNADITLLTHFSARYPKMPPFEPADSGSPGNQPVVALAFDHAALRIGDMWKIRFYLDALDQSYKDTMEEGDEAEASHEGVMEVNIV